VRPFNGQRVEYVGHERRRLTAHRRRVGEAVGSAQAGPRPAHQQAPEAAEAGGQVGPRAGCAGTPVDEQDRGPAAGLQHPDLDVVAGELELVLDRIESGVTPEVDLGPAVAPSIHTVHSHAM